MTTQWDGEWRVETSKAVFVVVVRDGKIVNKVSDYGLHLVGAPFKSIRHISTRLTPLHVGVPCATVPPEVHQGGHQMPRRRQAADYDPEAVAPIAPGQTTLEEQIVAAASAAVPTTNGVAHAAPAAAPVNTAKPNITKLAVTVRRVIWTEEPSRGSWEITAGMEGERDPESSVGDSFDRMKSVCRGRIAKWMAEEGLNA